MGLHPIFIETYQFLWLERPTEIIPFPGSSRGWCPHEIPVGHKEMMKEKITHNFTHIKGPKWILAPFPLNSWAMATPRWFIKVLLNLYNKPWTKTCIMLHWKYTLPLCWYHCVTKVNKPAHYQERQSSRWKSRVQINIPDAESAVLQAQAREIDFWNGENASRAVTWFNR
jgi:hypothetical protein